MKNLKKVISLMMVSALVLTGTPHNLTVNALTQYNPGVTVEKIALVNLMQIIKLHLFMKIKMKGMLFLYL